MTYRQAGQTITAPDAGGHGLDMSNGQDWLVEDCLIDLSACPLDQLDEAVRVMLRGCLIRNWGAPDRFDVRSFGAWAHRGGRIEAESCVFDQPCFWRGWHIMVRDWLAHIGQSWNDEGLRGLLRPANWLPGVCRGLVATAGGQVRAANCHATRWWIRLEGHSGPRMGRKEAFAVVERRERLRAELTGRFPAAACPGR